MINQALADAIKGVVGNEISVDDTVKDWLDTDYPPLNELLSGNPDHGVPYGRIIEVFGPPSCGKTWLASQIMIAAQKRGGVAIFNDHEFAFDVTVAQRNGLSTDPDKWVYMRPDTWEDSNANMLKIAKTIRENRLIPDDAPIVAVFDSVAAMIPQSMLYDSKGKARQISSMTMNDNTALARVSSTTLKLINRLSSDYNVIVIYLNQIRTKIGVMYGDPTTTPGGSAFEFYASIRLALGRSLVKDKDKEVTGQVIGVTTKKNKLNRPFQEIEMLLTFPPEGGAAFDRVTGIVQALINRGKLKWDAPRLTWVDGKKYFVKEFVQKANDEGLYPQLCALYKTPATAPVATPAAATVTA